MLLRFKIKNFLSFQEETVFDMFPNLKRESFLNHVYSDLEVPLLKQAAIYGANGSGKSNFIDAVYLLKNIVTHADALLNYPINSNKFRLASIENTEPIFFSIEFLNEKKYFIYNIEFNADRIHKEELFLSGLGLQKDTLIFRRDGSRILSDYSNKNKEIEKASQSLLRDNKLVSLFVLIENFPFFKDSKKVKIAKNWFESKVEVLSLRRLVPSLIEILSKDGKLLNFANQIFQEIGVGIQAIEIEEKKIRDILSDENEITKGLKDSIIGRLDKTGNFSQFSNDKILVAFEKDETGEHIIKRILFKHIGKNGFEGSLEMESQSEGTARILNLIPAFYRLENEPVVFFIDEIENSIHPLLMIKLIKHFSNSNSKGQLIYTTHETQLLNQQEVLRPDEVWFTEKHEGCTKMYSLNEFKIHHTINIQNGYLAGRYGGIPFLGNAELLHE